MSDIEHSQRCAQARIDGLKLFWISRGHPADEAEVHARAHLRGATVPINDPPASPVQLEQSVLAEVGDSGSESAMSSATELEGLPVRERVGNE